MLINNFMLGIALYELLYDVLSYLIQKIIAMIKETHETHGYIYRPKI